jgi:CheY-like chemotaxis protein
MNEPETFPSAADVTNSERPGVLIVEDDDRTVEAIARQLRNFGGFRIYHAGSVGEARRAARKYPTVRFIVLDVTLPNEAAPGDSELSGYLLLRELSELLPQAKIYMKAQARPSRETSNFLKSFSSVVRFGSGYDVVDIERLARLVYSDGAMRPRVFVIHGHDPDALDLLTSFIKDELRLDPVVIKNETDEGRVILEKFEEHARHADLVFALLTPDDPSDTERRARQNVIFEIGYFAAALGRRSGRIILLYKKGTEIPSDMDGLLMIDISEGMRNAAPKIRQQLDGWWGINIPATHPGP